MIIRAATAEDIAAIADIYAHYVMHSVATFEESPPSTEDMLQRFTAMKQSGLPYIVGEQEGEPSLALVRSGQAF